MRWSKTALILAAIALVALGAGAGSGLYALYQTRSAAGAESPDTPTNRAGTIATELPPKQFGKWVLHCNLPQTSGKACQLVMQVNDKNSKRVLMRLLVAQSDGKTMLTVATPPNASLRDGVTLTPDKGSSLKADFALCVPAACRAIHGMDDGIIAAISSSTHMNVAYTVAGGEKVSYTLPVEDFAQALAALKAS